MQEPSGADKVESCMRAKYSAGFHFMEKVSVNGPHTSAVYRFLRLRASEDPAVAPYIGWNFTLFIVARDGSAVLRPSAYTSPLQMKEDIERLLDESVTE
mmetsp:Transcript_34774/g.59616  ORF Transcript_34774/g.59616 Transcript_34774/m.59616 type:complete len:99 (+) Transcript_34774:472-768(+)